MSVICELSNDPGDLQDYYQIRQDCFRSELGIADFNGAEDEYDRTGHILIAYKNGQCIGGARISGRTPNCPVMLSLESPQFQLQQVLPSLKLNLISYCQISRLALHPDHRTVSNLKKLCHALVQTVAALGFGYAFLVSALTNARLYKQLHLAIGCPYQIHHSIQVPCETKFANLEHVLSVAHIRHAEPVAQYSDAYPLLPGKLEGANAARMVA